MKYFLPVVILLVIFSSCTTAYRSGQTPDDVYFSPTRPVDEYVRTVAEYDRRPYYDEYQFREDRYLRMRVQNRRWSHMDDDYFYSYRPYYYSNPYLYTSPWNSSQYWNICHNPYYSQVVYVPGKPTFSRPRTFNMNVYNNPNTSYTNPKGVRENRTRTAPSPLPSRGNSGGFLRDIFRGGSSSDYESSSGSSGSRSSGSGSSSSGKSGSSGSSSSGSSSTPSKAPVRKF